ncbi:MAG: T9SS type A sorting domain-containing protein [candidate division Zixibacteria bacterium]|nr:T9SS type A sorting domain-containing protein [candidate division Zixibacteria bacterium]
MITKLTKLLIVGSLGLLLALTVTAKEMSYPDWTDFFGSATLYNGELAPLGSVINAYDTSGTLCGSDTVDYAPGIYGFLAVRGDEADTDEDEGAELKEPIRFTINGRPAVELGPDTALWLGRGGRVNVDLEAAALVSMEAVVLPEDKIGAPGATIRYEVTVKNTGEGLDFYEIDAISNGGWIIHPQVGFVYADTNATATLYFDVLVPPGVGTGAQDEASFTVRSGVDPSVSIERTVTTRVEATDVSDDDWLLPGGFNLHQNYPNPFNPETVIAFELPSRAIVELEVYDLLGRRMAQYDLGVCDAGSHEFTFSGEMLASGVYFYRLQAGEFSARKKMILLK